MCLFASFAVELLIGYIGSYHLHIAVFHIPERNKGFSVALCKRCIDDLVSGWFFVAAICTGYCVQCDVIFVSLNFTQSFSCLDGSLLKKASITPEGAGNQYSDREIEAEQ